MSGPPVGLFGMVLGLGGLGILWREAAVRFWWLDGAAEIMVAIAAAAFVAVAVLYGLKAVRHPAAVGGEWRGPAHVFFAAITMALLLLAQAALPHERDIAFALWAIGCVAQLALAVAICGRWIGGAFAVKDLHSGWFLPVVGGMLATGTGVALGEVEAAWLFFGFGAMLGVPLLGAVLYRLCFVEPLPPPLRPVLVILIAPVALAYLAWQALNGGVLDGFARILFYGEIALALVVATRARWILTAPFGMSWWAVSFPLDLVSNATLHYARLAGAPALEWLGIALAVFTSAVILYLFARTLIAVASRP